MEGNLTLEQVKTANEYNLFSMFEQLDGDNYINDSPFQHSKTGCTYYEPAQFSNSIGPMDDRTSFFHLNCRGLSANWDSFRTLLCDLSSETCLFDYIGISEAYRTNNDNRWLSGIAHH